MVPGSERATGLFVLSAPIAEVALGRDKNWGKERPRYGFDGLGFRMRCTFGLVGQTRSNDLVRYPVLAPLVLTSFWYRALA